MNIKFYFSLSLFLWFYSTVAMPERGDIAWTMLLCKYRDSDFIPHDRDWYLKWLTDESAEGSIAYFFQRASNGIYTIGRSRVHGWFEIPFSRKEVFNLANNDERLKTLVDSTRRIYVKTKQICHQYAVTELNIDIPSTRRLITIVNDEDTAVFCLAFGVLVTPRFLMTTAVVHEMSHSFNLGHSYSDLLIKVFSYAEPGEYDDRYDLMSTANAHMYTSAEFGPVGPGFNGPHLDYLGWLPSYRLYFFGRQDPDAETTIRLSSLSRSHKQTSDWLLILIPYDRDDPQKVYTVEFRTREVLDAGIPDAVVVVHQISRRDNNGGLYSKILNQGNSAEEPSYELKDGQEWRVFLDNKSGYVKVKVESIDELSAAASVTVTSTFSPTSCAKGEVQRSAFEFDLQCVSVAEKEEIQKQNRKNSLRRAGDGGACLAGYVLRKAGPQDDVCVTEFEKETVQKQNDRWRKYREFYKTPTFGLNSCQQGYVWRQLDTYDYVCVEKSRQREIDRQNEQHENRRSKSTPTSGNECSEGFVWRQAINFDEICVLQKEQLSTKNDNEKNVQRLVYQKFFNADNKLQL